MKEKHSFECFSLCCLIKSVGSMQYYNIYTKYYIYARLFVWFFNFTGGKNKLILKEY